MQAQDQAQETYDAVVVGGGPAGATAAADLAARGRSVLLLDRAGRIKPCGGAIPPRLIRDFAIPDDLLVARVTAARMVSPAAREVDMPIEGGFVGMVDRDVFDEWLRERAAAAGAVRRTGSFERLTRDDDGVAVVHYQTQPRQSGLGLGASAGARGDRRRWRGLGGRAAMRPGRRPGAVRVRLSRDRPLAARGRAVARLRRRRAATSTTRGALSPDFYGWIFPHGDTTSVGTGTARKGFSLRDSVGALRARNRAGGDRRRSAARARRSR